MSQPCWACAAISSGPCSSAGAESAFRRADGRGDARAAGILGELLRAKGDLTGALAAFTRAHERARLVGDTPVVETREQRIAELEGRSETS